MHHQTEAWQIATTKHRLLDWGAVLPHRATAVRHIIYSLKNNRSTNLPLCSCGSWKINPGMSKLPGTTLTRSALLQVGNSCSLSILYLNMKYWERTAIYTGLVKQDSGLANKTWCTGEICNVCLKVRCRIWKKWNTICMTAFLSVYNHVKIKIRIVFLLPQDELFVSADVACSLPCLTVYGSPEQTN